jgi:CheY-like chemotaxis protein
MLRMLMALPAILLVEDNSDDVALIRRMLRKGRILNPLRSVPTAEQAKAYLQGIEPYADRTRYPSPVLLLIDIQLPGESGMDLVSWVRGQPAGDRLRIIIVTGSVEGKYRIRADRLGVLLYLEKPLEEALFQEGVRALGLSLVDTVEDATAGMAIALAGQ